MFVTASDCISAMSALIRSELVGVTLFIRGVDDAQRILFYWSCDRCRAQSPFTEIRRIEAPPILKAAGLGHRTRSFVTPARCILPMRCRSACEFLGRHEILLSTFHREQIRNHLPDYGHGGVIGVPLLSFFLMNHGQLMARSGRACFAASTRAR
jgi:hypothetical protein